MGHLVDAYRNHKQNMAVNCSSLNNVSVWGSSSISCWFIFTQSVNSTQSLKKNNHFIRGPLAACRTANVNSLCTRLHSCHLHTGHSSAARTASTPKSLSCRPGWCRVRPGTWRGTSWGTPPQSPPGPRPCRPVPAVSYPRQRRTTCWRKSS